MIKAIIFDFDGVLVESADIKTEAFRDIFSRWPDKAKDGLDYHRQNMGISRYVKFEHFYRNVICQPYSQEIGEQLAQEFSQLVLDKVKRASFVKGAKEFLEDDYQQYLLFIASGTPQNEMDSIVLAKDIGKYFRGIFGSPASKAEIVNNILTKYSLDKDEIIFVGDALSDKLAAEETGVKFILRINQENKNYINYNSESILDFKELKDKIRSIEQQE